MQSIYLVLNENVFEADWFRQFTCIRPTGCTAVILWTESFCTLEMWANDQCDGRPAEHRWRPLFNAAKFG